jgi:hypothetical protein
MSKVCHPTLRKRPNLEEKEGKEAVGCFGEAITMFFLKQNSQFLRL